MREPILSYVTERYRPLAVIVYGSYADGSFGPDSDFDALALCESGPPCHDASFVDGVQLDLFVYPKSHFAPDPDWDEIIQIYHGRMVLDTGGQGAALMAQVAGYVESLPKKPPEQVEKEIACCEKMLRRTARGGPEGLFRWHWLLIDSLEIYFGAVGRPYWGPKKALKQLELERPQAFALYTQALSSLDHTALERWIAHIKASAQ